MSVAQGFGPAEPHIAPVWRVVAVVACWLLHAAAPALAQAPADSLWRRAPAEEPMGGRAPAPHPAWGRASVLPAQDSPRPYRDGITAPREFRGVVGDEAARDAPEIAIGWFGPADPDHPSFGTLWRGAALALDQENAVGGYRAASAPADAPGRPFRLHPVWSESPWTAGIGSLLRLVYDAHPWAMIGGVDGTTTHLALQVALKSHFTLVTPASTDPSTERANVPWLFSLAASDDALAAVVVPVLAEATGGGAFAVASSAEHDGHAALASFERAWTARGLSPAARVEFAPGDPAASVARVVAAHPRAVLVLGPAVAAGGFVRALRGAGFAGAVLGSATAATAAFHQVAGTAAEGVLAPSWIQRGPAWDAFADAYERRWHQRPDDLAGSGYDVVRLVAAAVRSGGLSRARIRDAVTALSSWTGACGPVRFTDIGRNQPVVWLGAWRGAQFVRQ